MNRPIVIFFAAVAAGTCAALLIGLVFFIYVGVAGPDTAIVHGSQVPKRYLRTMKKIDLLNPQEEIRYFYSDAMLDIREGIYLLTDSRLILYSRDWEAPLKVPYEEIANVEAQFNPSFWEDTFITVMLKNGAVWSFPLSSDGGRDVEVFNFLRSKAGLPPVSYAEGEE